MNITLTSSYILVEFDYRTVKIEGEVTLTPAFYASIGSIKNWEAPYQDMAITKEEKKEIIESVLEQNNPDFKILFED